MREVEDDIGVIGESIDGNLLLRKVKESNETSEPSPEVSNRFHGC